MLQNPQLLADFVTFTEEILHGKLHFLCSVLVNITLLCTKLLYSNGNRKTKSQG